MVGCSRSPASRNMEPLRREVHRDCEERTQENAPRSRTYRSFRLSINSGNVTESIRTKSALPYCKPSCSAMMGPPPVPAGTSAVFKKPYPQATQSVHNFTNVTQMDNYTTQDSVAPCLQEYRLSLSHPTCLRSLVIPGE